MMASRSSSSDYDRVAARNYARKYTDSCGSCHCSSCDPNNSVYNSDYSSYHKNDCANFVSQCINSGGISTDGTWKPGANAWVNTGKSSSIYGLTNYMVDEGYFFESTDKYSAFAGSIIMWTRYSHVGLVDQNDTVTMTFCAHTNDRKSCSFKNISDVKFFIPEWDSVSNSSTR